MIAPYCMKKLTLTDLGHVCRAVVPIGACYAGTLWLGNAAYLYLSVSFIQMLKVNISVCHVVIGSACSPSAAHHVLPTVSMP